MSNIIYNREIDKFNWGMVKNTVKFQVLRVSCK